MVYNDVNRAPSVKAISSEAHDVAILFVHFRTRVCNIDSGQGNLLQADTVKIVEIKRLAGFTASVDSVCKAKKVLRFFF